ncbi:MULTISPECIES: hypothetical protein [Thermocrispum]|uniref:Uncharacterized protein n=1 Tax=Thermocrispum agreste TaxID=37925 RepID=A0A2W4JC75_9PSEU|nr:MULTISPECIES: hypothetical protein [Thermocrispum]PZM95688.1 MAG: hypothetical protein DIU77_11990 [Thermocrispum agreste]
MTETKSIADSLDVRPHDEGLKASAERALLRVPFAGDAYKLVRDIKQDLGEVDGLSDLDQAAKSMAANGAKFVTGCLADAVFFCMDPIGNLILAGLDILLELVQPLQDALHYVSGDGPSLSKAADNFATIAKGFVELSNDFDDTADKALKDWQEDAGNAARKAIAEFSRGIAGLGSVAGSISEVLKTWGIIMKVTEEVIKAIITEVVAWLITIWLPALATSVITCGASVAAATAASAHRVAAALTRIGRYLWMLGRLLDELGRFLVTCTEKLLKLAEQFRIGKLVKAGERTIPLIGSKATHDMFQVSNRVLTTMGGRLTNGVKEKFGFMVSKESLQALGKGAGVKSGIGTSKALYQEGKDAYQDTRSHEQTCDKSVKEPAFDKSKIGGDRDPAQVRRDLQM